MAQWLKNNKDEIIQDLWYVIIDTDLSFCQDLIYSNIVELEEINKFSLDNFSEKTNDADREENLIHMPGIFCLLRKQIRNGIITADILKVLEKVCTNQELKEIMNSEGSSS